MASVLQDHLIVLIFPILISVLSISWSLCRSLDLFVYLLFTVCYIMLRYVHYCSQDSRTRGIKFLQTDFLDSTRGLDLTHDPCDSRPMGPEQLNLLYTVEVCKSLYSSYRQNKIIWNKIEETFKRRSWSNNFVFLSSQFKINVAYRLNIKTMLPYYSIHE